MLSQQVSQRVENNYHPECFFHSLCGDAFVCCLLALLLSPFFCLLSLWQMLKHRAEPRACLPSFVECFFPQHNEVSFFSSALCFNPPSLHWKKNSLNGSFNLNWNYFAFYVWSRVLCSCSLKVIYSKRFSNEVNKTSHVSLLGRSTRTLPNKKYGNEDRKFHLVSFVRNKMSRVDYLNFKS